MTCVACMIWENRKVFMQHTTVKELPESERPYERFLALGAEALSDAELLSIILKTGTKELTALDIARQLLSECHGNLLNLYEFSYEELMEHKGIGPVKAIQLKAVAELSKRIARTDNSDKLELNKPETVAGYYMETLRHQKREVVMAAFFDAKCHFLGDSVIATGGSDSACVAVSALFQEALKRHAVQMIVLHNHPSGNLTPSEEDIKTTERIAVCGRVLGIPVVDHIICAEHGYISMRSYGYEHLFNDSENDLNKIRESETPVIRLPEDKDEDYSSLKISREVNGKEMEIPLTRDELSEAFFEQQRIWDESYVRNYLNDLRKDKEKRLEFKSQNGIGINSILKSDKTISRISAEMRRKADKYGMSDYEALEEAVQEEAAELERRRKEKSRER